MSFVPCKQFRYSFFVNAPYILFPFDVLNCNLLPLFEELVVSTSLAVFCELVFLDFVCFVYSTNLPIGFFSMLLCVFSYCQLILSVFVLGSTTIGLPLCNHFLVWMKRFKQFDLAHTGLFFTGSGNLYFHRLSHTLVLHAVIRVIVAILNIGKF